ncbi:MAG TPA: hypothetical protein VHM70_27270, partial [Polyangiaceae bacterium]|nr:hypothetical protein [Polyangiaceae bacterium]
YGALSELAIAFSEALKGEVSPVSWFKSAFKMILAVVKALETEERGVSMRAWCYTTVYDAMGMGAPAAQVFNGSLRGPEQDAVNQQAWDDSVAQCKEQLADGAKGVALRNRVLLLIAKCSANPGQAVTELWANACEASEDRQLLAAFPVLDWPEPTR